MNFSIDNLIKTSFMKIIENAGISNRNFVLIKEYGTIKMSENDVDEISSGSKVSHHIHYHQFNDEVMSGAYEPFLDYISDSIKILGIDIDEMFDECKVIFMHRELLKFFFEENYFNRKEILLCNEVPYEKDNFEKAIRNIFKYILKRRPTIFILNSIHMAGLNTIKLIDYMINEGSTDCSFFMSYDTTYRIPQYMYEFWNAFIINIKEYEKLIEWHVILDKVEDKAHINIDVTKLDEYYIKFTNLKETFCWEEALYYLERIAQVIKRDKDKIDIVLRYKYYGQFAILSALTKKAAKAILYCNEISLLKNDKTCDDDMKLRVEFFHNYILGYTQIYNDQPMDAKESARRCLEAAYKKGNEVWVFSGKLLEHLIRYSGWKDNIWIGEENKEDDEWLIEEAEKIGYFNHMSHISVYAFNNDPELFKTPVGLEERIANWKKGYDLAIKLDNTKFALEACRKVVMLASTSGYYDTSDYMYMKYIMPIVMKTNNLFEEANVYNGLGFNKCMKGDYATANDYYKKALSIFIKIKNYEYVAETLYNIAINAMMAKKYAEGDLYISGCMRVMTALKLDKLRISHMSKIYCIKALCTLMIGNVFSAEDYVLKAKHYLQSILTMDRKNIYMKYWKEDVFIYHFVVVCINIYSGKDEEAKEYMDALLKYLDCGCCFEGLLRGCRTLDELRAMVKIDMERSSDMSGLTNDKYTIKEIISEVQSVTKTIEYDYLRGDLEFLYTWKQLVGQRGDNPYLLVESAVCSFKSSYNVENFIMIQYTYGQPAVMYNGSDIYINKEMLDAVTAYFKNNRVDVFTSKLERESKVYKKLVSAFTTDTIVSFFALPFYKQGELDFVIVAYSKVKNTWNKQEKSLIIEESNIKFYSYIFNELIGAIERIEDKNTIEASMRDNKMLEKIARYDHLTQLNNRQGFYDTLAEYDERGLGGFSLAYIDLDNFKYYNDSFGHDIGDVILKEVAEILNSICNENEFAVRYGGDEFLLMLNTTDLVEAKQRMQEVYRHFSDNNYYIDRISEIINKSVEIPKKYRISCSIGIARIEGDKLKEGMDEAINKADQVLYAVKKTTKNECKTWDEIKPIIDKNNNCG